MVDPRSLIHRPPSAPPKPLSRPRLQYLSSVALRPVSLPRALFVSSQSFQQFQSFQSFKTRITRSSALSVLGHWSSFYRYPRSSILHLRYSLYALRLALCVSRLVLRAPPSALCGPLTPTGLILCLSNRPLRKSRLARLPICPQLRYEIF